jgi:hypothetical protein
VGVLLLGWISFGLCAVSSLVALAGDCFLPILLKKSEFQAGRSRRCPPLQNLVTRSRGIPVLFGRAGLAIPRSTLAQWVGVTGGQLQPLVDALREVVFGQQVMHADETPVQMLMLGIKKTHPFLGLGLCN